MIASLLHLPAFHNMTSIINLSHGTVLESLVEVCSLEVLMLTHLPLTIHHACTSLSLHGHLHGRMLLCVKYNRVQLPQIGQASDFHVMYCCRRRRSEAAGRKRGTPKKHIGMNQNHLILCAWPALKCQHFPSLHPQQIQ